MKRLIILLSVISLVVSYCLSANSQSTKPSPEQYLTAEQLAKYQSDLKIAELEKKLQTYGKWVGVGGEIGIAVKEGLSAVVDVSEQFSNTNVGRFTMIMIAWKVLGKDLIRIILGLLFISMITPILYNSLKKTCIGFNRKIKGKGIRFWEAAEYEWVEATFKSNDDVNIGLVWFFYMVLIVGNIGITYLIMFA